MSEVFLEDLEPGQIFSSGTILVEAEEIIGFAAQYDPQPFHLSEATAKNTFFRGLAASGWHTAALTMKLLVESDFKPAGGLIGASLEDLRWPRPVRPSDELKINVEILEVRASRSKPHQGIAKIKTTTLNQHGKAVQIYVANIIVLGREKTQNLSYPSVK